MKKLLLILTLSVSVFAMKENELSEWQKSYLSKVSQLKAEAENTEWDGEIHPDILKLNTDARHEAFNFYSDVVRHNNNFKEKGIPIPLFFDKELTVEKLKPDYREFVKFSSHLRTREVINDYKIEGNAIVRDYKIRYKLPEVTEKTKTLLEVFKEREAEKDVKIEKTQDILLQKNKQIEQFEIEVLNARNSSAVLEKELEIVKSKINPNEEIIKNLYASVYDKDNVIKSLESKNEEILTENQKILLKNEKLNYEVEEVKNHLLAEREQTQTLTKNIELLIKENVTLTSKLTDQTNQNDDLVKKIEKELEFTQIAKEKAEKEAKEANEKADKAFSQIKPKEEQVAKVLKILDEKDKLTKTQALEIAELKKKLAENKL